MKRLLWLLQGEIGLPDGFDAASADAGSARFEDLGFDSLDMVVTWSAVEDEFKVKLPETLGELETVSDLWRAIEAAGYREVSGSSAS